MIANPPPNIARTKDIKRMPNFEILRSVAMLFIVVWHFCVHGITENSNIHQFDLSLPVGIFNAITTHVICSITGISVNLFVLITGYFLISKPHPHWLKIEKIWAHAMFYSLVFALVKLCLSPDAGQWKNIARLFYMNEEYWFVNKYIGLMVIAPFCAQFAQRLTKKEYLVMLFSLAVINITFFAPFFTVIGEVNGGYSLQWFVFVFLVGGYIKNYDITESGKNTLMYFIVTVFLHLIYTFISKWLEGELASPVASLPYNGFLFIEAAFFFLAFKNHTFISPFWKPLIQIAPYTFGVYLIHCNHILSPLLWIGDYSPSKLINSIWLIPCLMFESCLIFILAIFTDWLRHVIISSIGVNRLLVLLNEKLSNILQFLLSKTLKFT